MRWVKICCLCLCLPLLTACDYGMLEREIYPLCISLDLETDGRYTVGVQAPENVIGDAKPVYDILTATGASPQEALDLLATSTPFPLNFCQVRLCLVSYELSTTQPLRPMLSWLLNLPTMRPNVQVMVSIGQARQAMAAQQPDFGMRLSNHLNLLFQRLSQENRLPKSTLAACVQRMADPLDDLLLGLCAVNPVVEEAQQSNQSNQDAEPAVAIGEPWSGDLLPDGAMAGMLPREGLNPVEYLGSAVVAQDRVRGVLNARQTQLMLIAIGQAKRHVHFSEQGMSVTLETNEALAPYRQELQETLEKLRQMGCDLMGFSAELPFRSDDERNAFDYRSRFAQAELLVQ